MCVVISEVSIYPGVVITKFDCIFIIFFSETIINVLNYLNKNNAKFRRVWLYIVGLVEGDNNQGLCENDKAMNIEFIEVNVFL